MKKHKRERGIVNSSLTFESMFNNVHCLCFTAQSVNRTLAEWIKGITASSIMNNPQVFTEFMEVCSDVERGADVQVIPSYVLHVKTTNCMLWVNSEDDV